MNTLEAIRDGVALSLFIATLLLWAAIFGAVP